MKKTIEDRHFEWLHNELTKQLHSLIADDWNRSCLARLIRQLIAKAEEEAQAAGYRAGWKQGYTSCQKQKQESSSLDSRSRCKVK